MRGDGRGDGVIIVIIRFGLDIGILRSSKDLYIFLSTLLRNKGVSQPKIILLAAPSWCTMNTFITSLKMVNMSNGDRKNFVSDFRAAASI